MQDEEEGQVREGGLSLGFLARGLLRYKLLIAAAAGLGAVFSIYEASLLPDQYSSSGQLFVQGRLRDTANAESVFGNVGGGRVTTRELIMTELEVLNTPILYQRAAEKVGFETVLSSDPDQAKRKGIRAEIDKWVQFVADALQPEDPAPKRETTIETKREIASLVLASRSSFRPRGGTSLITVSSIAESPDEAQATTQALLDSAIEVHAITSEAMASLDQIEKELGAIELAASEAVTKRDEYGREHGIYSFEAQKEGLASYLSFLNQQRDAAQFELDKMSVEFERLESELKLLRPLRAVPGGAAYVVNPLVAVLEATLEQIRLRRMDLSIDTTRMADSQASLRARRKGLDELESETQKRLIAAKPQIALKVAEEENPRYGIVRDTIAQSRIAMSGLNSQIASHNVAIEAVEGKLNALLSAEPQWQILDSQVKRTTRAADRLASTVADMRAMSRMQQQNSTSLKILQQATYNPVCIGPARAKMVIKGTGVGGILGLGLALAMIMLGRRIVNRHDLVRAGIPEHQILQFSRIHKRSVGWVKSALPARFEKLAKSVVCARGALSAAQLSVGSHRVAVLPCDARVDPQSLALSIALDLSALIGARTLYVSCLDDEVCDLWPEDEPAPALGFADVLAGKCALRDAIGQTEIENLDYVRSGLVSGGNHVAATQRAVEEVMESASDTYRFVVIACQSIDGHPLMRSIVGAVDTVSVVVRAKQSRLDALRATRQQVDQAGLTESSFWVDEA